MEQLSRDEIFALAAAPIGGAELREKCGGGLVHVADPEAIAAAKRASKIWLPRGKSSANTNAAREVEREAKARNFDIEDAIEAAGGQRGAF